MPKLPFDDVVRIVDDFRDKDPKTRDSCPGKVFGHKLIRIGSQWNRRLLFFKKLKHVIFLEEGTRNIWYKDSFCNAGVVAMGFSRSRLDEHPNAVPMETYAKAFLDKPDATIPELHTTARDWLERNDFKRDDLD